MVHAYTPRAIQRAIAAGVKCIEHGQLADEATAKLMAEKDIWWSLQPFLDDEDAVPFPEGSANRKKQVQMTNGTDNAYKLAIKYKIKTAWGAEALFDEKLAEREAIQLAKMTRWYTPAQVLKMATADNAELLTMSGPRNPYPGKLGVIEEGALVDLLLVNGDPVANLNFDEHGLGLEPNNLVAIHSLRGYRTLRWGRNVELIITDQRSYRSEEPTYRTEAQAFMSDAFPGLMPQEVLDILDGGSAYNNGHPPPTIRYGGKDIANFRRDQPPTTILGVEQKAWFLERLKQSKATWKIWGDTVATLDMRADPQNLPIGLTKCGKPELR